jgi:hypothetical protein
VARSGLDLAIEANADRYEDSIASNEAAQKSAGHWGVPLGRWTLVSADHIDQA